MAKLRLTVAAGDYDIVRPLKEGLVEAAGLELIFLTDMGPRERHWRLARKTEFDGGRSPDAEASAEWSTGASATATTPATAATSNPPSSMSRARGRSSSQADPAPRSATVRTPPAA